MIRPWTRLGQTKQCISMAANVNGVVRRFSKKIWNFKKVSLISCEVPQNFSSSARMLTSSDFLEHYAKLPNLPVPKLEQTLDKYLRTVKSLLTENEFAITTQVTKNFGAPGGVGEKLQKILEEKGLREQNWLSRWWLDVAYLSYRLPVVVHSNPGLVTPKQTFQSQRDQLIYAAKLIAGALLYKDDIDKAKLKQDYLGKSPLDMSQYRNIFSCCRIPGTKVDDIRHNHDSKHIIIAYNNKFFKMEVYLNNGKIAEEADIIQSLTEIVKNNSGNSNEPVGFLTTENRNVWGTAYEKLRKDPVNCASLKSIEDSMFLVCIDKENRIDDRMTTPYTRMGLQVLHGNGSDNNSGNRWFDKTLQFIIGTDGVNGICYEHSPAEGPPIATLADYVVNYARNKTLTDESVPSNLKADLLPFNLTDELRDTVNEAKRNIDLLVQDVELNLFTFDTFGKEDIKALKMSPDSFIQIAIQMSFIRLHGQPAAHYESASTRKFTSGRTETIRSCLPEIVDFAKHHLVSSNQRSLDKYNALQSAMKAHKDYVSSAINGQAIDRHLLGLKMIAIENNIDVPVFYLDPGYSKSNNWRCSTSQVAGVNDVVMGFGPVVPDGYGCCYNPRRDVINFAVSAFNSNPTTSAQKFGEALRDSLVEIRDIAASHMPSKL